MRISFNTKVIIINTNLEMELFYHIWFLKNMNFYKNTRFCIKIKYRCLSYNTISLQHNSRIGKISRTIHIFIMRFYSNTIWELEIFSYKTSIFSANTVIQYHFIQQACVLSEIYSWILEYWNCSISHLLFSFNSISQWQRKLILISFET